MSKTTKPAIHSATDALPDSNPLTLARAFIAFAGLDADARPILRHWRGDFYRWDGSAYRKLHPEWLLHQLHSFLCSVHVVSKNGKDKKIYSPEPRKTRAVLETLVPETQAAIEQMPAWLDKNRPATHDVIAFKNGILNVAEFLANDRALLLPPTSLWFSEIALPYEYDRDATCPQWMNFLSNILVNQRRGSPESLAMLQEWFGYCMTIDTRHQKLMMIIGPPRSGKGTITRTMQRVIGEQNCAAPPISSLATRFGLEPLIGKRVAIAADAHLGRDSDAIQILDRLLQITGEDSVVVERKYQKAVASMSLGVRFTIAANEAPDLPDASGAIIPRLLMLRLEQSFAGREDTGLDQKLTAETPGIAIWALEGLKRLRENGGFTEPEHAKMLRNDYLRQSAPIQAFLQDRTELGNSDDYIVDVDMLWMSWKQWAQSNGHHPGSKEGFGKRLRAARPTVYKSRPIRAGQRMHAYIGLRLIEEGVLPFHRGLEDGDDEPA